MRSGDRLAWTLLAARYRARVCRAAHLAFAGRARGIAAVPPLDGRLPSWLRAQTALRLHIQRRQTVDSASVPSATIDSSVCTPSHDRASQEAALPHQTGPLERRTW